MSNENINQEKSTQTSKGKICGIDLGTSNSVVAIPTSNDGVEVLADRKSGRAVVPSIVYIPEDGSA